jgi:hypothetical protein
MAPSTNICGYPLEGNIYCPTCATFNPNHNNPLNRRTVCHGPRTKRMFITTGGKSHRSSRWIRVIVDPDGKEW